jgi:hypothetical protein
MKSLKNYIYEANLQGSTTKFSGALGAFKQYVELNPKNVEFKVDKTTVLSRMDGSSTDITVKKGTTFNIMDRETKLIKKVGRSDAVRIQLTDRKFKQYHGQDFLLPLNKILKPTGKQVEALEVDISDKKNPRVFTPFKTGHGHEGQFTEAWIKHTGDRWQFEYKGKEYKVLALRAPLGTFKGNPKTDVTVLLDKAPPKMPSKKLKYSLKAANATYFENWMLPKRFMEIFGKKKGSQILNDGLKDLNTTGKIGGTATKTNSIAPFISKKWNIGDRLNPSEMMEVISGDIKFDEGEGAANAFFGGDIPTGANALEVILSNTKSSSDMSKIIKAGISMRGSTKIGNFSCYVQADDGKWYISIGYGNMFDVDKEYRLV